MSVIAVKGFPYSITLKHVVKILAPAINGQFEPLNFVGPGGRHKKTCYVRLSERLDPSHIVEKINTGHFKAYSTVVNLSAFVAESVPDLPISKPSNIPTEPTRSSKTSKNDPEKILEITQNNILQEMQLKYGKLYDLSAKTGHQLLENISMTIKQRLLELVNTNSGSGASCCALSKAYRTRHPHFGDFQLALSTLHALRDAAGAPRDQINEQDFRAVRNEPSVIDNIPFNKLQSASNRYADKIIKKLTEHIKGLDEAGAEGEPRRRVRRELGNMEPYIPHIVRQVLANYLVPDKKQFLKVYVYGEPSVPARAALGAASRPGVRARRSATLHNLLTLHATPAALPALLALDNTVVNGNTLVVRSGGAPLYHVTDHRSDDESMEDE